MGLHYRIPGTDNFVPAPYGNEMQKVYPPTAGNLIMQDENGNAADAGVTAAGLVPWALASNENLLINWYFADPINQRNLKETSAAEYFVDRWRTNSVNVKLTLGDGCIVATTLNNITVATWALIQNIESPEKLIGTQLTLSLLVEEVVGEWSVFARFSTKSGSYIAGPTSAILKTGITTCTFVVPPNTGDLRAGAISMIQGAGQYIKIRAAKLELGDHQTLAHQDANGNWVLNDPPPDKELELIKCQRFYNKISPNIAFRESHETNLSKKALIQFLSMRVVPNVTLVGTTGIEYLHLTKQSFVVSTGTASAGFTYLTSAVLDAEIY
ncbi:MAG: hypothetical protein HFG20_05740 [Anaerotruncus sp.]|nr:hypothetical protein [Anaerotruncus sp.]